MDGLCSRYCREKLETLNSPLCWGPAFQYGIENLKLFRDDHRRRTKPMPADDLSFVVAKRSAECPVCDFGQQLINEYPSITANTTKDVTRNFPRCSAYAVVAALLPTTLSPANPLPPMAAAANSHQLVVSTNKHDRVPQIVNSDYKAGVVETRKAPPPSRPELTLGSKYRTASEELDRLDDRSLFPPPKPYLPMPRTPSPVKPPQEKQRVT